MNTQKLNILVDSSQRSNSSDATGDFNVFLTGGPYVVHEAKLRMLSMPLTTYNITSSNNTFYYIIYPQDPITPVVSVNVTIPEGRYSPTVLVDTLNDILAPLASSVGSLSISYNCAQPAFTLTATMGASGAESGQFTFDGTFIIALGFEFEGVGFGFFTATTTSLPTFINYNEYYKLCLTFLTNNVIAVNNNRSSVTFILENHLDIEDDCFGRKLFLSNAHYDSGGKCIIYDTPVQLQNFKISIRDADDEVVDFQGLNWWAVIELQVSSSTHLEKHYAAETFKGTPEPTRTVTPYSSKMPLWLR